MDEIKSIKERFWKFLEDYWWLLLIVIGLGYFLTDISVFRYIFYAIGIVFALFLFLPFIIQFFAPAYILITSLVEHFKSNEQLSPGRKYIFIPSALFGVTAFITAQLVLSTWVTVLSVIIWTSVIGFFLTLLLLFFFGLVPLAMFAAPFVVWYYAGFTEFLGTASFFLLALFWYSFSKLAFSEDYRMTAENFLGYSPQVYLLGALSSQVVALPFYQFGLLFDKETLRLVGDWIGGLGGAIFIILALASWINWLRLKKRLLTGEVLYKPPVWIYIVGFFTTSILYQVFLNMYKAPVFALYWLNAVFFIAIIVHLISFIKNRFVKKQHYAEVS